MRSSTAVSPVTSIGTLVLRDRTLNSGSCPVDTASTLDLFRFARQNFDVELSSLIQASELQAQSPRTTLICQLFWQLLRFSYVFQFCYTEWRHLHYTEYVKAKNKSYACVLCNRYMSCSILDILKIFSFKLGAQKDHNC